MVLTWYLDMRKTCLIKYVVTGIAVLLFASCRNRSGMYQAHQQIDSLRSVVSMHDSLLGDVVLSFSKVEANLHAVAAKQNMIVVNSGNQGELKPTAKERINAEITAINDLMDENRKMIADLSNKYDNSNKQNTQLRNLIKTLNDQVAQKDNELAVLNERLNTLHAQVTGLQTSVDTLTQTMHQQTTAMHTAFYIVGKTRDLEKAKIIDRTGGFLGIGRGSKLSADFDQSQFTQVDFTQMGAIPIDSKNVKIITTHPANSFSLTKDKKDVVKSLVITDPEKFWETSKYLVVVKE